MAMLAERKRKQKWSLNPRGKDWAEDSNKFGQKLMEKMGWTSGKGLGANENGMTEHVKVSYKNDSKGIGFKESDNQWTEHEANFSALLESLTGEDSDVSKVNCKIETSLEKKSQSSRARVHYHKFTRGKDLSRYSEKDLANIFGKKSLKDKVKTEKVAIKEEIDVKPDNSYLINSGSMADYFKKKLPHFGKQKGLVVGNNGVMKIEHESDSEDRIGFGFRQEESFVSYVNGDAEEIVKKRKTEDSQDFTPNKKLKIEEKAKKKKKSKKQPQDDSGLSNPAFDPLYNVVKVERHSLTVIEEVVEEEEEIPIKKKKIRDVEVSEETPKKKKKNKDNPIEEATPQEDLQKKKRRSNSKNEESGFDNTAFSENLEESKIEVENPYEVKPKSKKKKKKNSDESGVDNSAFSEIFEESAVEIEIKPKNKKKTVEENSEVFVENPYEVKPKSKKKKKRKSGEEGIDNPNLQVNDTEQTIEAEENPFEVKIKSKKRKQEEEFAIDNPNFRLNASSEVEDSILQEDNPYEVKSPKKKKKKKIKVEEQNSEESKENLDSNPMPECDFILNVVTTPIIKAPNSQPKNLVRRRKSVRFSEINEERIIPNKEDLQIMSERNELFDINTQVIENGLEDEAKRNGTVNSGFDMSSIDQVSFYEQKSKSSKKNKRGLENKAFDEQKIQLDEDVDTISKTLDRYQAEIENDINEAKVKSVELNDIMVGEVGNSVGSHEKTSEGTKLKFHKATFGKSLSYFENMTGPRKAYKHLIKGDIVVTFKNTNLHEIEGYAVRKSIS